MISKLYNAVLLIILATCFVLAVLDQAELSALPLPFFWIELLGVLVCVSFASLFRPLRIVAAMGVTLLGILALLEITFDWSGDVGLAKVESGGDFHWKKHDEYGYVAPAGSFSESKTYNDELIYQATYTTNEYGHRVTGGPEFSSDGSCALFFGDGYTFGWGLDDDETLPFLVATRLGPDYRVVNMSFLTHGPHQMLAQLETETVAECADEDIVYVIYVATLDQVRRAAGLRVIDQMKGPRYVLANDGTARRAGRFGSLHSREDRINSILTKSSLYRAATGGDGFYLRGMRSSDIELYTAILRESKRVALKRFPTSAFIVVTWSGGNEDDAEFVTSIERSLSSEFDALSTDDVFDRAGGSRASYTFGKFSIHPNYKANAAIAEQVGSRIMRTDSLGD